LTEEDINLMLRNRRFYKCYQCVNWTPIRTNSIQSIHSVYSSRSKI